MIIFFVRRFNDIDHLVPVIYKISSISNDNILILCLNPSLSIKNDYRLNFLKNNYSIEIDYVYRVKPMNATTWLMGLLVCNRNILQDGLLLNVFKWVFWSLSKIARKWVGEQKYQNMIDNVFHKNWAKSLIENFNPEVLIFDWIKRYQHNSGVIMDAAKEKGIKLVALPHGINFLTTEFHTNQEEEQSCVIDMGEMYSSFDYFFLSNNLERQQHCSRGVDGKKIVVKGSSRFSKEWVKINDLISPSFLSDGIHEEKLKVVFMEHSSHYRANDEQIIESINKIAGLDFVHMIIKAHTRSNKFYNNYSNVDFATSEVTSTELCKWSDAVIVTMSSIAIEPLLNGKVLIYPEYFHRNKTLWGDLDACWKVDNQSELFEAMYKLKENPKYRPYSKKNVQNFLNEAIYNGDNMQDILKGYSNFILKLKN